MQLPASIAQFLTDMKVKGYFDGNSHFSGCDYQMNLIICVFVQQRDELTFEEGDTLYITEKVKQSL